MKSSAYKEDRQILIDLYLSRIIEEFDPQRVYLTGSAVNEQMLCSSDFDFIVESDQPVDADAIIGALDIIPIQYATKEMLENAIIIYERGVS